MGNTLTWGLWKGARLTPNFASLKSWERMYVAVPERNWLVWCDLLAVIQITERSFSRGDISNHATIEHRPIGQLVVHANQEAVFSNQNTPKVGVFIRSEQLGSELKRSLKAGLLDRPRGLELEPARSPRSACGGRHWDEGVQSLSPKLSDPFVRRKPKGFVLGKWPAEARAKLIETERGNTGWTFLGRIQIQVKEGAGIQGAISKILKKAAVEVVCTCLGDDVYLSACSCAVLRV